MMGYADDSEDLKLRREHLVEMAPFLTDRDRRAAENGFAMEPLVEIALFRLLKAIHAKM